MGDRTPRTAFVVALAAAIAGRIAIFVLLRSHWGWQPPYHLAFLSDQVRYDPSVHEYLVWQMPLYSAFLKLAGSPPFGLYLAAPLLQTALQLVAIAWLARTLATVAAPRQPGAAFALAFVLGLDPWLCDTAIIMQPASLSATVFIVLVERTVSLCAHMLSERRLPAWTSPILAGGLAAAAGSYLRVDFLTYAALPALAVGLMAWTSGITTLSQAAKYAIGGSVAAGLLVVALLLPRAVYLQTTTGTFTLTTNASGGTLWFGLGEIANPWMVPNPEDGDEPIEAFAVAHGHKWAYASVSSSRFFRALFYEHLREQPAFMLKLIAARLHRVTLGWPPASVSFYGEYEIPPGISHLGEALGRGTPAYRLLLTREYGPWVVKQLGLRYLADIMLWLMPLAALWYAVRPGARSPLLAIPLLAYAVGIGVFILVHWSARYGQQFYWLGSFSAYLLAASSGSIRTWTPEDAASPQRESGGTGRRAGLRSRWP